jgi:hypothetical protein
MTLALSLIRGHGFSDISRPDMPHFLWWPPGFPVFIGGYCLVFGMRWTVLKILIIAGLFTSYVLFVRMLARAGTVTLGGGGIVLAAIGLNSDMFVLMSYLYSEAFFTAQTLLFFALFARWRTRIGIPRLLVLSLWAVYIAAVRNIGIAMPVALAMWLGWRALRERNLRMALYAVVPLVLAAGYIWAVTHVPAVRVGTYGAFFRGGPGYVEEGASSGFAGFGQLGETLAGYATTIVAAIRAYAITLIPALLAHSTYHVWSMTFVKAILMLLVSVVVFAGWLASMREHPLMGFYVACYMTILLIYPPLYTRLIVPLMPLFVLYLYRGAATLMKMGVRRPRIRTAFAMAVMVWLIVDNVVRIVSEPYRYMPAAFGGEEYQRCLAWVVDNAGSADLVATQVPHYLFLRRGGRGHCIPLADVDTPDEAREWLRTARPRYVMISGAGAARAVANGAMLASLNESAPQRLVSVCGAGGSPGEVFVNVLPADAP